MRRSRADRQMKAVVGLDSSAPLSRWFSSCRCSTYKVIKGKRWGGHKDTLWGRVAFMGMSRAAPESSGSRGNSRSPLEATEYLVCVCSRVETKEGRGKETSGDSVSPCYYYVVDIGLRALVVSRISLGAAGNWPDAHYSAHVSVCGWHPEDN
jgi:hypothetical protein